MTEEELMLLNQPAAQQNAVINNTQELHRRKLVNDILKQAESMSVDQLRTAAANAGVADDPVINQKILAKTKRTPEPSSAPEDVQNPFGYDKVINGKKYRVVNDDLYSAVKEYRDQLDKTYQEAAKGYNSSTWGSEQGGAHLQDINPEGQKSYILRGVADDFMSTMLGKMTPEQLQEKLKVQAPNREAATEVAPTDPDPANNQGIYPHPDFNRAQQADVKRDQVMPSTNLYDDFQSSLMEYLNSKNVPGTGPNAFEEGVNPPQKTIMDQYGKGREYMSGTAPKPPAIDPEQAKAARIKYLQDEYDYYSTAAGAKAYGASDKAKRIKEELDNLTGYATKPGNANAERKNDLATIRLEQGLRKEVQALPIVKNFNTVKMNYENALQAYKMADGSNNPQWPDQVMIVTFNKLIDPNSVVMPAEFNRSAEGASLIERIKGYIQRLGAGGTISKESREQLYSMIGRLYNVAENNYKSRMDYLRNQYESYRQYGIDPERIIQDAEAETRYNEAQTPKPEDVPPPEDTPPPLTVRKVSKDEANKKLDPDQAKIDAARAAVARKKAGK